jgi:hypothetical protein
MFQQLLPPSLFSAFGTLAFPVVLVFGDALKNEKTAANEKIATTPGIKLTALTGPALSAACRTVKAKSALMRDCRQDFLEQRRLQDHLGMTQLAERNGTGEEAERLLPSSAVCR